MGISRRSIEEVIDAARIEEVVSEYVQLKRRGSSMQGLCPFHTEKTPSFNVSPARNIFKCFGCGRKGDSVTFIMEHENVSFPEAIRKLAVKYQIRLEESTIAPDVAQEEAKAKESLFILNAFAAQYFKKNLTENDEGIQVGASYFKERGISPATIDTFQLGYATSEYEGLVNAAIKAGYELPLLQSLHLANASGKDFFRERVMFTLQDIHGKVIGFAGRVLKQNTKAPKYINSAESEIYVKSKTLYGIFQARQAIRKADKCYLVEGYTDVLTLHQSGIQNVVASSGTALTPDQIQMIHRLTPHLCILYDGDSAGIAAANRGLQLALQADCHVTIVVLPQGQDPDSFMKANGNAVFNQYILENEQDFILFKIKTHNKATSANPFERSELINDIVQSISVIPDPLKRSTYITSCAQLLKTDERLLVQQVNQELAKKLKELARKHETLPVPKSSQDEAFDSIVPKYTAPPQPVDFIQDELHERQLLKMIILYGNQMFDPETQITVAHYICAAIDQLVLDAFDNTEYAEFMKYFIRLQKDKSEFSPSFFAKHENPPLKELALDCMTEPFVYSENWEKKLLRPLQSQKPPDENYQKDALQSMLYFKLRKYNKKYNEIKELLTNKTQNANPDSETAYLAMIRELVNRRNEIAKELNIVILPA